MKKDYNIRFGGLLFTGDLITRDGETVYMWIGDSVIFGFPLSEYELRFSWRSGGMTFFTLTRKEDIADVEL